MRSRLDGNLRTDPCGIAHGDANAYQIPSSKSQAPTTPNLQRPNNSQPPTTNNVPSSNPSWDLVIGSGWSLELGIWDLTSFPTRPTPPRSARAAAARRPGGVVAGAAAAFLAAASVHDPFGIGELVAKTAFQPAAHAGQPRGV